MKKYCDNYDCPIPCEENMKHIPKKQKAAVFINKSGVCRKYIAWLVDHINDINN